MFFSFPKSGFLQKSQTLLAWSFFVLFSLLYSTTLFASSEQALKTAIERNNIKGVINLLKEGVNPQKIKYFYTLPSCEISELLLKNEYGEKKSLDPNNFLDLVLSYSCNKYNPDKKTFEIDKKSEELQYNLVDLALNRGANLDQSNYPEAADAFRKKEAFIGRKQKFLLDQLLSFLDCVPDTKKIENTANLEENFKESGGHCMGLTTLWLYSKWLQFTQPEKTYHGYSNDWFKNTTRAIASYDNTKNPDNESIYNLQKFASIIDFFQNPPDSLGLSIESHMASGKLDTNGKTLKKKYTIVSVFTLEKLQNLLKSIVYDDELIYVRYPNHATGLFKHGKNYYFYDPNNDGGEYKNTSIEKIAETIFEVSKSYSSGHIIGFIIIGNPDEKLHSYPERKDFLKIDPTLNKDALFGAAMHAAYIGCAESLWFLLDQKVNPNQKIDINLTSKNGYSLLDLASIINHSDIVTGLLIRGADPNQISMQDGYSALHIASGLGNIEVIKSLLNTPTLTPTDINLANEVDDGKTPLMYAAEEGHTEIVELLLHKGADLNKKDKNGKTALMLAEENEDGDVDEYLVNLLTEK